MKWIRLGKSNYEISDDGQVARIMHDKRHILHNYILRNKHRLTLIDTTDYNRAIWKALNINKKTDDKHKLIQALAGRSTFNANQITDLLSSSRQNGKYSKNVLRNLAFHHLLKLYQILYFNYHIVLHVEANDPTKRIVDGKTVQYITNISKAKKYPLFHQGVLDFLVDEHLPIDHISELMDIDETDFDDVILKYVHNHNLLQNRNKTVHLGVLTRGCMAINWQHTRLGNAHLVIRTPADH